MPRLCPCPRCARHVRLSEPACPFCGSAVRFEIVSTPFEGRLDRLRREAQLVFGAGLFGVVTASCQPEHPARVPLPPNESPPGRSEERVADWDERDAGPKAEPKDAGADSRPFHADPEDLGVGIPMYGMSGFFIRHEITFESGSAELSAKGRETLGLVKEVLDQVECYLLIDGYADKNEPLPKELSKRRAETVRRALLELGIQRWRLAIEAHGTNAPYASSAKVSFRMHRGGEDAGEGICWD
jgi:outer membrane protein OmpA-like peptidoglycan-associated protein